MEKPDIMIARWQRLMTELACDENYYGYIYMTTNLVNGMRYIGQHSSKEFDKYYYGSGRLIKKALSECFPQNHLLLVSAYSPLFH